ncbi:MAG: T9SS type A sorting domain-containing protein [Dysgonamonadaceae bacterium]|jgi:hypothetical protein|nr:T9SS type A sorting domain-containing protein [Dysgonamonadaceae bacterium]
MKKTIFFLLLVFTVSMTAENRNSQFLQQMSSVSALQQTLRADRTVQPVQRNAMKTVAADIPWNDIGTLSSWSGTVRFDKENTALVSIVRVDDYGNETHLLCYPVKFTLAQGELLSMKSDNYNNDFTLYADPQAQQEVAWGYTLWRPFQAGEYYLLISESGSLNYSWGEPFDAALDMRVLPAAGLSLPAKQDVSITKDNSFLLVNTYHTLFYKFTLTEDALVNFGCDFDPTAMGEHLTFVEVDLITENIELNATKSDLLLQAGDYYLAVYGIFMDADAFWATHSAVEAQLDIKIKTLDAPAALSIPFEQDFSLSPGNAYSLFDMTSVLYTLHLENNRMIEINTGGEWRVDIYEREEWKSVKVFYPWDRAVVQLSAGDYYVAIGDYNGAYDGTTPVDGHLIVDAPLSYATLDFSEPIAVGETKTGGDASLINVITDVGYYGIETQNVAAYHFAAQAGHIYKFVMECYTRAASLQPTLSLFRAPNTGDIYADNIRGAMPYIDGASGTGTLTWQSDVDADVNVMFFFNSPKNDVIFKLTLEEPEATHTDAPGTTPAYEDITLPFLSWLHFDPAYHAYWNAQTSEYEKEYRLTLAEKTRLTMAAGFNSTQGSNPRLKLFTDEERTQQVGQSWGYGEGDAVLLDAGVYYLAITDLGYFNMNNKYAECLIELTGSPVVEAGPVDVTVARLMDNPALPVITSAGLPYTDAGYYVSGSSELVTDPAFFITRLFANGYKLTLNAGEEVHIVNRQPEGESESSLRVFQKEAGGTYSQLADNSIDWDFGGVTHILFKAPAAGDYYVMVSTSNSYPFFYLNTEYPSYRLAIWTGTAEDEPVSGELQLPGEVLIVSTEVNVADIVAAADAARVNVRLALMQLEVTGTTRAGGTVVFENDPMAWEINEDATEASFMLIPPPYLPADTYVPAKVRIKADMGMDAVDAEPVRIVSSGNGFVTVFGVQDRDAITLLDINGRILRRSVAQGTTAVIATGTLPRGVYIVAVHGDRKQAVLKFIR